MFALSGRVHPWRWTAGSEKKHPAFEIRKIIDSKPPWLWVQDPLGIFRCLDMCQEVIGSKVRISGSVIHALLYPIYKYRLFHPSTTVTIWIAGPETVEFQGRFPATRRSQGLRFHPFWALTRCGWLGRAKWFWYLDLYESKSLESVCEECYWRRLK